MANGLTIDSLIKYLIPEGTLTGSSVPSWNNCPTWPPDLFILVALIAERSGCYAEPGIVLSRNEQERNNKRLWATKSQSLGVKWSTSHRVPREVNALWAILFKFRNQLMSTSPGSGVRWKRAVIHLLAIADEACAGVGFIPERGANNIAVTVFNEYINYKLNKKNNLQLPNSIGYLISSDVACVLPKSLTPTVGCTLRSLTHHLALLPGAGVVGARWDIFVPPQATNLKSEEEGAEPTKESSIFNMLLIPFPYDILSSDFVVKRQPMHGADGYFALNQGWLKSSGRQISTSILLKFVMDLIKEAEHESGPIHGIVFPEAALRDDMPAQLARGLARKFPKLELVISGVLSNSNGTSRNQAVLIRIDNKRVAGKIIQNKHHRWMLNKNQIIQYNLDRVLDVECNWWESIDVHRRSIQFGQNKHEAVIVPLICEDLARFDPVLPFINAVGPNLVIALLMDGPQLQNRWPGRYATVLAEDPGSAVLTFTSIGMVKRSRRRNEDVRRTVALWKQPDGQAQEIYLPSGSHGVVLALRASHDSQRSLDFRGDSGEVTKYALTAVRCVQLPRPPHWLSRS